MLGETVGIFLGEQQLSYAFLKREINRWVRQEGSIFGEISGRNSIERLGSLLGRLKPKRGRRLCIALPRSRYFLRDIKFKGLSLEEAEGAVRLSIGTYTHLPPEDIYFDCTAYERGGKTRVLIAYARRNFIDSIVEQVERTGHRKSLFCISPCSLGADLILRKGSSISFPCLSIHKEDGDKILNLHGRGIWQGCHPIKGNGPGLEDVAARTGHDLRNSGPLWLLGDGEVAGIPHVVTGDPCSDNGIKPICHGGNLNPGVLAAALGTSSFPQVAFQEKPRKKPLYLRINTLQLALVGLFVLLVLFTGNRFFHLMEVSRQYNKNVSTIKELEERFAPLKAKMEKLQGLKSIEQDMLDFLNERPPLLDILKELAEKTPMDAWIRYFTLRGNVLKVSAEGGSAVKTMEAWRRSNLFSSVKLASPVTKDRQGRERYTVELRLRTFIKQGAGRR